MKTATTTLTQALSILPLSLMLLFPACDIEDDSIEDDSVEGDSVVDTEALAAAPISPHPVRRCICSLGTIGEVGIIDTNAIFSEMHECVNHITDPSLPYDYALPSHSVNGVACDGFIAKMVIGPDGFVIEPFEYECKHTTGKVRCWETGEEEM
jgi:hypothetical protein